LEFGRDEESYEATKLDLPDLTFDAVQYLAEVERATRDRAWEADESPIWHVVRRLREQIRSVPQWPSSDDWRFDWVVPDWGGAQLVVLSFHNTAGRQKLVRVNVETDDPLEEARRIATQYERGPAVS
jgi:hypothetical protein